MFENLTDRLSRASSALKGRGRITDDNVRDTLRQVRMALLEADVALPVVKGFIERTRSRALGAEVTKSLSPGQAFVKIIHDELVRVMGSANEALNLRTQPPAVVLLAGLQGAGKTTTAAKLAALALLGGAAVDLMAADTVKTGAVEQLAGLARHMGLTVETVSRTLARFRKQKLLKAKGRDFHILDLDGLTRLAESNGRRGGG